MAWYYSIHCGLNGMCARSVFGKFQNRHLHSYGLTLGFTAKLPKAKVSKTFFEPFIHRNSSSLLMKFPRAAIIAPVFSKSAAKTKIYSLCVATQCQLFHTTQPKRAIPPALWLLLRPVANLAAIYFGRHVKKLWKRMPQDKRERMILRLKKNKRKILGSFGLISLGVFLYILAHIEEVPYTKRRRFILFSQQDMRYVCTEVQEEINQMYQMLNLNPAHPLYRRIQTVMVKLMEANREEIIRSGVTSWEIHVIDEPSISNAMVLPNGSVFIFSGIMETCSNDDQLGAVLAHEIAHVLLNHQGETLSKEHFFTMVSVLFITAIWALLPDVAAFLSHALLSKSSAVLIHLPFSRRMETEADLVGLGLAAKACFDVREASVFWAKMALLEELGCQETPIELLSSHPSSENRSKFIDELIPEILKLRESCKCRSLSTTDPRVVFSTRSIHLKEAKLKGCISCDSIFSRDRLLMSLPLRASAMFQSIDYLLGISSYPPGDAPTL